MKGPPSSVIHINFIAGPLIFDARPVWSAAREAESKGKIPEHLATRLYTSLGDTAIHLGTRHYVMKRAIDELKASLRDIYNLVPDPWSIPNRAGFRVVSGKECEHARDRVLLAIDSFLFRVQGFPRPFGRVRIQVFGRNWQRTSSFAAPFVRKDGRLNR